jgi:type VI secretion system VasD/TssJ family lipoprotein
MKNSKMHRDILEMDKRMKFAAHHASRSIAILSTVVMAGCGAAQALGDGTVDAAKWAFTTQVKTMNVDLSGRAALNADVQGQSLSTVVRFYQLKEAKTFAKLNYSQLQSDDLNLLKADLLATKDVVLRPGASASLAEPMNPAAQVVGGRVLSGAGAGQDVEARCPEDAVEENRPRENRSQWQRIAAGGGGFPAAQTRSASAGHPGKPGVAGGAGVVIEVVYPCPISAATIRF